MAKKDSFRLAILGAGPIGLEAALYAHHLQLPFTVYERGRVGEHVQRWGHVKLFSPFGMNATSLGLSAISASFRAIQLASPAGSIGSRTLIPWPSRPRFASTFEPTARFFP